MSKYFSFCNKSKNSATKTALKPLRCFNLKHFGGMFLSIVLIGLIVGYVLLANSSATKGFEIAELEGKIKILQEKNKNLTDQVNDTRSLSRAEEKATEMNLVAVDKVEYLKVYGSMALGR